MNEKPGIEKTVHSVVCSVKDCIYHHAANMCTAHKINVSNEKAQRKAETFCATFENRAEF